ncbi:hypothetical protein Tco_0329022, partial [Tanacetum coccineum]
MAHNLMDQVVQIKVAKDADNKRKWEDDQGRNFGQNKRHEVVRVYVIGSSDKKRYAQTLPLCDKCKFHHHHGPCLAQCENCKKERIEKTKRSKNDQKQARNGKKTKSKEQDKESSQRSQPDQPDTVKLIKDQGLNLPSVESIFIKKEREENTTRAEIANSPNLVYTTIGGT